MDKKFLILTSVFIITSCGGGGGGGSDSSGSGYTAPTNNPPVINEQIAIIILFCKLTNLEFLKKKIAKITNNMKFNLQPTAKAKNNILNSKIFFEKKNKPIEKNKKAHE